MSEVLELTERAALAIRVGESHFREFKSAYAGAPSDKAPRPARDIAVDIGRTLVAFANADGGELLIGVEDDGTVTGLPQSEDDKRLLLAAPSSHVHSGTPLPPMTKALIAVDGKELLYFYVPKGLDFVYLTSDGRCIRREDRQSVPDTAERIVHSRAEDRSRVWDRQFAPSAVIEDLDLDLLNMVASQVAYGVSPEKLLQYFDLAEFTPTGLRLKNAALVLFAKDVRNWHPRCQVRIVTVRGRERLSGPDYNVVKDDVVSDNILTLADTAWERLTLALAQQPTFTETARFEQNYLFPQIATREALLNAIVHRDYAVEGRGIEISIFSDRMEITSPGMLLSTVSIDDLKELKGVHESRNPLVARLLREIGLVREMGEGLTRIFTVMRSNALAQPELASDSNGFTVTLFNKSLYDADVNLWLSTFDDFQLTEPQRAVMALGYGGREFSAQDAIDTLGIIDVGQLQDVLTPLRTAGIIERTKDRNKIHNESRKKGVPTRKVKSFRVAPHPSGVSVNEVAEGQKHSVFLGNLPLAAGEQELTALLSGFGTVLSLSVPPGIKGDKNRGYAFATLETSSDFDDLLKALDQLAFYGRKLRVSADRKAGGPES